MIEALVIADSINNLGNRLITYQCRYPRFIHPQVLTHRQFSRNARSSRATPGSVNIEAVEAAPALPARFGRAKKGMSPGKTVKAPDEALRVWRRAARDAVEHASTLKDLKVHKQWTNRVLEPFMHIDVVISATEFGNFFALRRHEDAQEEIAMLAEAMWIAKENSKPVNREWHLPYVSDEEFQDIGIEHARKASVARCARVSVKPFDSQSKNLQKDLALYNRLLNGSGFGHWSPFESVARACNKLFDYPKEDGCGFLYQQPLRSGNFQGWIQWRKTFSHECLSTR